LNITRITAVPATAANGTTPAASRTPQAAGTAFANCLREIATAVNAQQLKADATAAALATGQAEDLHEVILEAEKANLSLELLIQLRNRALEAYQEIMRMPV